LLKADEVVHQLAGGEMIQRLKEQMIRTAGERSINDDSQGLTSSQADDKKNPLPPVTVTEFLLVSV
jgi:hypothetical protein